MNELENEGNDTAAAERRATHPLGRLTQQNYQNVIDQQIAAGQAAGMFDKLEGAGKPLQIDDDTNVPEELRIGFGCLKTPASHHPGSSFKTTFGTNSLL